MQHSVYSLYLPTQIVDAVRLRAADADRSVSKEVARLLRHALEQDAG